MFRITKGKGFNMDLPNGVTVSVQWGPGNYCDKRFVDAYTRPRDSEFWASSTAEVAAWRTDSEWTGNRSWVTKDIYPENGTSVLGYLKVLEVLDFINKAAALPQEEQNASTETGSA